jgi:hypothetical protein
MPVISLEAVAGPETHDKPILWRLGKLFGVVTNIQRARVTDDYAFLALSIEGSAGELERAKAYLRSLHILRDGKPAEPLDEETPEQDVTVSAVVDVHIATVNPQQAHSPILYRLGKDFNVVVNLNRAAFDEQEGGSVDITISGPLSEVQRAIAYLHTTGVNVNPLQRSVTDRSNL